MAATQLCFSSLHLSDNSSPRPSYFHVTMFSFSAFVLFLALLVFIFTLYATLKSNICSHGSKKEMNSIKIQSLPVIDAGDAIGQDGDGMSQKAGTGNLGCSFLLEIVPSNSGKWETVFDRTKDFDDDSDEKTESVQDEKRRRKKKRVKNKTLLDSTEKEVVRKDWDELVCLYPFTKSCSATQRKIKQQYDQLVKSHGSKGLTLEQIGQFVNCLIEAKHELQHKSEVIKRRFKITKALLFKADRSTIDRLRQQIYRLELEQKRLDEDTLVYNWLQEQLKASPAYKKMLEIGACMEMEAKSGSLGENADVEFSDMSFEELLAQEKKDAFWQKNRKLKPCSG